ncbi:MAG TPA: helix-turn-helix domain-containing protein, partial [Marmoricola sp.]|nr:helix-turn-helix domain-containing protein [Marmoricola sp.]
MTIEAIEEATSRPGVVDRMTQILDLFLFSNECLLLEDVQRATDLPRSTAFRMLSQLVRLRWLEHSDRGYGIGARARGLRGNDPDDLRYAAAPVLNDLHVRTGGVAHLTVMEGSMLRYLDKIGGTAAGTIPSRVGARLSPDRSASGRCLLAMMPAEDVDALLIASDQPRTAPQLNRLHADLHRIRSRRGLSIDNGERTLSGITSVAAPI